MAERAHWGSPGHWGWHPSIFSSKLWSKGVTEYLSHLCTQLAKVQPWWRGPSGRCSRRKAKVNVYITLRYIALSNMNRVQHDGNSGWESHRQVCGFRALIVKIPNMLRCHMCHRIHPYLPADMDAPSWVHSMWKGHNTSPEFNYRTLQLPEPS